ncbi:MAG TPA: peptide chain release factor N(5)-glutamine methyltransferase [Pyrinomonadaceae bacterium]|nr:peptide chain release factor N(5)-glutamine methyltransferase [Pyrinomonadaceae bacterium]
MYSIKESVSQAASALQNAGVPEPRREAASLLAHKLSRDRTFLFTHGDECLSDETFSQYMTMVQRRAAGEPLQYITGLQDFYGRQFHVTPDVLIPRPETELLVEAALRLIGPTRSPVICDVGTGSGCIAISILCEKEDARAVAIDISPAALKVAKQNSEVFGVTERIDFVEGDCFDGLDSPVGSFDLIVSNPPYVSADVVPGLQREVRDYEPLVALSPGGDGLSVIRRLMKDGPTFLKSSGYMLLEIGFDQGEKVTQLVENPWHLLEILPDLQGIPRIVILKKS